MIDIDEREAEFSNKESKFDREREKARGAHNGRLAFFSLVSASSSFLKASLACEREETRILSRHSRTHAHLETRSSSDLIVTISALTEELVEDDIHDRRYPRPRIGARDKNERKTSLRMISGEVNKSCTVLGLGDGVEATVCRMSPI